MDTMQAQPAAEKDRVASTTRWSRGLLGVALACFTLPFLTVNCYGDDVTVSGVQAATTIDLTRQADPDPADEQFAEEGEPPNVFAMVALLGTAAALALSFGSASSRRTAVWSAATAAIALEGLYMYAFYRAHGEALPDVGLPATMILLVAAAWLVTGPVPRWIGWALGVVAVTTVPYSLLSTDDQLSSGALFLAFVGGAFILVGLAGGAVRESIRPRSSRAQDGPPPTPIRLAIAGFVGLALLSLVGVGSTFLMGAMLSDSGDTSIGTSGAFAILVLGLLVGTSNAAWSLGRRIAYGPRRIVTVDAVREGA